MALDGKILARARDGLAEKRAANTAEHERRQKEVVRRIPAIGDIDRSLRLQMTELVGLTIKGGADMAEKIAALERENLALQQRKAELLEQNGYTADYLDEIISCPHCRDTGFVGSSVCSCLMTLYNRELTRELGTLLRGSDECFERFDLSLYGEAAPAMEIVYHTCREYAANFSERSMDLLFQGGTGLGKTFLSASVARVVAEKGFSVCYDTASAALEAFETKKFSRDPEAAEKAARTVERMLSCDLMILDDLGTEMATPMALSALYTLINTRLVNNRKMIISTNLSDEELSRRYTPQICSRIEGEFTKLPFAGRDIRKIRKEI